MVIHSICTHSHVITDIHSVRSEPAAELLDIQYSSYVHMHESLCFGQLNGTDGRKCAQWDTDSTADKLAYRQSGRQTVDLGSMTCCYGIHTNTYTHQLGYPDLPLNRITSIMGGLVSPHQRTRTHTQTHSRTTHHNGSLGRLIRMCAKVCVFVCGCVC